ncbi:CHAP domain-containing protein [Herbiconiux sp. L3-i23]|uniref:CHAP domain-containing protein n=1 Tax=Herbiconiux sp. L3-i23 TaxID=2905871 RepID=UPI002072E807|nr:CHAP domain-containing protein [Herbiconiux sp. L3-i23]
MKKSVNPLRVLITVLVVPGLVATAALPAYASTFSSDAQTASSMTTGQSLSVAATAASTTISRDGVTATSDAEMAARKADPARELRVEEYDASGARELGDDYPWPYEASDDEGGGLSPLNYYYRECVDFVAWRLNRDAGSTSAPWKYVWSNLTPNGGNASAWASNWKSHGWPTGSEPVPGSVAWFNGNHVAYVKAVTDDGQVVIEEYNHGSTHKYGIRTIPASSVALFLYAPPR